MTNLDTEAPDRPIGGLTFLRRPMELPYSFLYSQNSQNSVNKILNTQFHGPLLKNINSLHRQCNKEFIKMKLEYIELLKGFVHLDDKGAIQEPDGPGSYKIKDGQVEACNKAIAQFMERKFQVRDFQKINLGQLLNTGIQLSSVDIQNLEPILDGLDFKLE